MTVFHECIILDAEQLLLVIIKSPDMYAPKNFKYYRQKISRIPLRICISIRLGRNPALRPLTKPEPGCTDPMGMAPKLVPG